MHKQHITDDSGDQPQQTAESGSRHGGPRMRRWTALAGAIAVTAGVVTSAPDAHGDSGGGALQHQLADVRQATAKFHDVAAAEAAGYINPGVEHCVECPAGGMGIHFVNPRLLRDGQLDPTKPEILLYATSGQGLRLVGVEYLMPTSQWSAPAPNLFGKPLDGPMPEHEPNTTGERLRPARVGLVTQPKRSSGHVEPRDPVLRTTPGDWRRCQ